MFRTIVVASALAAITLLASVRESSAITISRNNPYRSFNVTGYNYGSVQWEKQHGQGKKSWSGNRSGRRIFRRW